MIKNFIRASRLIAGSVFIFSGLVKGVDPLGSMYKFIDYFSAFGMDSLNQFALVLGIVLSAAEFLIGFCILTGLRFREAAWGILIFMALFTPLTLYLAVDNPVSDCGCFGDAIHLTNWQTFFKNIILLLFVIPLFLTRNKISTALKRKNEWLPVSATALLFLLFTVYNYRNLPVIDFRPYSIGANITEGMTIPEDATADQYEIKLIYEKDGRQQEFTLENYPGDDTTWVFIDQQSELIKKGYEPPIHDFILSSPMGDDLTDYILGNSGMTLLMISGELADADTEFFDRGIEAASVCTEMGIDFYLLTASPEEQARAMGYNHNILFGDETMIKTVIRANPGFVLISGGTIIAKWAGRNLPDSTDLVNVAIEKNNNVKYNENLRLAVLLLAALLYSLIVSLLLRKKLSENIDQL